MAARDQWKNGAVRYLTIVRHAKAEKAGPAQRDKDRALNERGRRQCEQLRRWASDEHELGRFGPTTALVSAATRTKETFERAFAGTPFVTEHVESELIYNGLHYVSAEDVLIDLAAIDPVTTSLLVIGHNPTVLELLATLVRDLPRPMREGYPLAGAFVVALPGNEQIGPGPYELVARYVPD
ncbi:MAG: histidine phosphatase family protein [Acidimicrobiales bacterium]